MGVGSGQMFLRYELTSRKLTSADERSQVHQENWNSEQIRDFVRKLGFVDKDKAESGVQIKRFLSLNQVCGLSRKYVSEHAGVLIWCCMVLILAPC